MSVNGALLTLKPRQGFSGRAAVTVIASDMKETLRQPITVSIEPITPFEQDIKNSPIDIDREVFDELDLKSASNVVVVLKDKFISNNLALKKRIIRDHLESFKNSLLLEPKSEFGISQESDGRITGEFENLDAVSLELTKMGFEKLKQNPDVEAIFVDRKFSVSVQDSVPLIRADLIKIDDALKQGTSGICVLDTGVDIGHPLLSNSIIGGFDVFDNDTTPQDLNNHGTHVAGIIKVVYPYAAITPVKVCNDNGVCKASDVLAGLDYCIGNKEILGIQVISGSFGDGLEHQRNCVGVLDHALAYLSNINVIPVFASGNNGFRDGINYPACSPYAVSVGASTKSDKIAEFTNLPVDVLAPGVSINSSVIGGYGEMSGTSMSAPHVAGVIALLKQVNSTLIPLQLETLLVQYGKTIDGYSRVDAYSAYNALIKSYVINAAEQSARTDAVEIIFKENVDLQRFSECAVLEWNHAEIDAQKCPEFNKPALIKLHDIEFTNSTTVLKDGKPCQEDVCTSINYDSLTKTVSFNVTGFSTYSIGTLQDFFISATTISDCGTISTAGDYVLGNNLSTAASNCLTISVDNVTVDCSGYNISSPGTGTAFVSSGNRNNFTVRNCFISGFNYGITATISNLTVTNTTFNGTKIDSISTSLGDFNISGVTCKYSPIDGQYCIRATGTGGVISNVTVLETKGWGFDIGSQMTVKDSYIDLANSSSSGIRVEGTGTTFTNITIVNLSNSGTNYGFYINGAAQAANSLIGNNFINGTNVSERWIYNRVGANITNANWTEQNYFTLAQLIIHTSKNVSVSGSSFYSADTRSIYIGDSANITVYNTFVNNTGNIAIDIADSRNITIQDSRLYAITSGGAVCLTAVNQSVIFNNNITYANGNGLLTPSSRNLNVTGNRFSGTIGTAVFMGRESGYASVDFFFVQDNDFFAAAGTLLNIDAVTGNGRRSYATYNRFNGTADAIKLGGLSTAQYVNDVEVGYNNITGRGSTTTSGIVVNGCNNILSNNNISYYQYGIEFNNDETTEPIGNNVTNNNITDPLEYGLYFETGTSPLSVRNFIANNTIFGRKNNYHYWRYSNITIENFEINENQTMYPALIVIVDSKNVTIRNMNITSNKTAAAIYLANVSGAYIFNNTMKNNTYGVYLQTISTADNVSNVTIIGNWIIGGNDDGIYDDNAGVSQNLTFYNNTILWNDEIDYGIYIETAATTKGGYNISANNISLGWDSGIYDPGIDFSIFQDNYIDDVNTYGIAILGQNNYLRNNTIKKVNNAATSAGIFISGAEASYNLMEYNYIENSSRGIEWSGSYRNNSAFNNTIYNSSQFGLYIGPGASATYIPQGIYQNKICQNNIGVYFTGSGVNISTVDLKNNYFCIINLYPKNGVNVSEVLPVVSFNATNLLNSSTTNCTAYIDTIASGTNTTLANDNANQTIAVNTTLAYGSHSLNFSCQDNYANTLLTNNITFTETTLNCGLALSADITLTNNLTSNGSCFAIRTSGLTLDCNGYSLTGNGTEYGIIANYTTGTTIKNCLLYNFSSGVLLNYTNGSTIHNVTAMNNNYSGIYLGFAFANNITYNTISSNKNYGIYLEGSNYNNLTNNTANNNLNNYGIGLSNANFTRIVNNTAINNSVGFYLAGSGNNTLNENTARNNTLDGFMLHTSHNNTLLMNTANNNSRYGIYLFSADNNTVTQNRAYNNSNFGIYLHQSDDNVFLHNQMNNNTNGGLSVLGSAHINLTNNTALGNSIGFRVFSDSYEVYLINNTANNNLVSDINITSTHSTIGPGAVIQDSAFLKYYFESAQFSIENSSAGKITFINPQSVTESGDNLPADLKITQNRIFVNTSAQPGFNITANLSFYGIYNTTPMPLADIEDDNTFEYCTFCTNLSYTNNNTFVYNVTHFTTFKAEENIPPEITAPNVSAPPYYSNVNLVGNTTYTDIEGEAGTIYFKWWKNGVELATGTNASIANGTAVGSALVNTNFAANDAILLEVWANDGTDNSTHKNSSTVTIIAAPVAASSAPGTKGSGTVAASYYTPQYYPANDGTAFQLFDIIILHADSPVEAGDSLDFSYFIKAMSKLSGDVEIEYWLETIDAKERVTDGSAVIYFRDFEEKTLDNMLYIPKNLIGVYSLYVQATFNGIKVKAKTIIEVVEEAPVKIDIAYLDHEFKQTTDSIKFKFIIASNKDDYKIPLTIKEELSKNGAVVWQNIRTLMLDKSKSIEESILSLEPGKYQLKISALQDDTEHSSLLREIIVKDLPRIEQPSAFTKLKSFILALAIVAVLALLSISMVFIVPAIKPAISSYKYKWCRVSPLIKKSVILAEHVGRFSSRLDKRVIGLNKRIYHSIVSFGRATKLEEQNLSKEFDKRIVQLNTKIERECGRIKIEEELAHVKKDITKDLHSVKSAKRK